MSIPSHIIDQINSQADLVSIIGRHTTLKKAGNEYKGCCPFHGEKTPSFYVNPQKNFYHCFGCGASGNAIGFLKDYEKLTFIEAVKELSKQTGIEIPEDTNQNISYRRNSNTHNTSTVKPTHITGVPAAKTNASINKPVNASNNTQPNDININKALKPTVNAKIVTNTANTPLGNEQPNWQNDTPPAYFSESLQDTSLADPENNVIPIIPNGHFIQPEITESWDNAIPQEADGNLYELLENIHVFYQQSLQKIPQARGYFESRGLTQETISTFGLGYAPAGWQHLEAQFPNDIEGLKVLGLVRTSEKGRDYDLLRDRVIFPIRDNQGRIIGFAGRALDNEVKPKYINSSDSPVFHKQHVLYGYYESRQQRANNWLVVEGYMDVIALYQAGIYGAVASMGTAINQAQIARLLTLNPVLTLSFDGDAAGQKAAWRSLEICLPILSDDKELRFLTLPNNHDPDTFIAEHGKEEMQTQITNATPLSNYVFNYLSNKHDLSIAEGKAKLMSDVRGLTNQLPKGSSFKHLLNNDIYQRLSGRKASQRLAQDAMLNFSSRLTINLSLYLCLVYQPQLLIDDPIQKIWDDAQINKIKSVENISKRIYSQKLELPILPTWKDLEDPYLLELVNCIESLLPHLPDDTYMAGHYIIASLSPELQQILAPHWQDFYNNLIHRNVLTVDSYFTELMIEMLYRSLKQQHKQASNILIQQVLSWRWQHLITWRQSVYND